MFMEKVPDKIMDLFQDINQLIGIKASKFRTINDTEEALKQMLFNDELIKIKVGESKEKKNALVLFKEYFATLSDKLLGVLFDDATSHALFGRDFTKTRYLTKGGFGEIHIGTIVKKQIARDFNSGESSCVIKIATLFLDRNMFLQEMAIHETFRENKYFAKLICYSEDPQTIVLKLYRFGALNNFIWPEKDAKLIGVPYTLGVAIDIAKRLAWCINIMHQKGFIHDDIKPGNILLDSDNDEPIFPVISDFGNVKIINSAEVVRGMELVSVAGQGVGNIQPPPVPVNPGLAAQMPPAAVPPVAPAPVAAPVDWQRSRNSQDHKCWQVYRSD